MPAGAAVRNGAPSEPRRTGEACRDGCARPSAGIAGTARLPGCTCAGAGAGAAVGEGAMAGGGAIPGGHRRPAAARRRPGGAACRAPAQRRPAGSARRPGRATLQRPRRMGDGCRTGYAAIPACAEPCGRVAIGAGSPVPGPGGPAGRAGAGRQPGAAPANDDRRGAGRLADGGRGTRPPSSRQPRRGPELGRRGSPSSGSARGTPTAAACGPAPQPPATCTRRAAGSRSCPSCAQTPAGRSGPRAPGGARRACGACARPRRRPPASQACGRCAACRGRCRGSGGTRRPVPRPCASAPRAVPMRRPPLE